MVALRWLCCVFSTSCFFLLFLCWPFYVNFYKGSGVGSYFWVCRLAMFLLALRLVLGLMSLLTRRTSQYRHLLVMSAAVYSIVALWCALVIVVVTLDNCFGFRWFLSRFFDPAHIFPTSILSILLLADVFLMFEGCCKMALYSHSKNFGG